MPGEPKQMFSWGVLYVGLFSGQQAGTAQRGTKDGEEKKKEQFQLTHAKVKVILMDKEEDKQGEKKKEKKVSVHLSHRLQEVKVEQRRAYFFTPCGVNARQDIDVIHPPFL